MRFGGGSSSIETCRVGCGFDEVSWCTIDGMEVKKGKSVLLVQITG